VCDLSITIDSEPYGEPQTTLKLSIVMRCDQQMEDGMHQHPPRQWDSSTLENSSRAWFVTKWPGKYAGTPDADILFAIEIPRSHCLHIQLSPKSTPGWEHTVLCQLANVYLSPDVLITDNTRLLHALVSAGSGFQKPATAYLDKPITLMPAIHKCLLSLADAFNLPIFQTQSSIDRLNEELESWRIGYNNRDDIERV
jgi:hypothetical protein